MKTLRTLTVCKLSTATVYKLVATGLLCSLVPIFIVLALLSVLGWGSMQWGGKPVQGWSGLLTAPFMAMAMALFLTAVVGTLVSLGLWLFSFVRPISLVLLVNEAQEPPAFQDGKAPE